MNFLLSDTQREMQDAVRRVLAERCGSVRLHAVYDGDRDFDADLWDALRKMGVAGLHLPESCGGAGLELIDLAIVAEALGAAAAPLPFLGHSLAALAIHLAGSAAQRQRWLPRLASGEVIGGFSFAESSDQWQVATGGRITGTKRFVSGAAEAGVIIVGIAGSGLMLVEPGAEGVSLAAVNSIDRTRRFSSLSLEAMQVELLPQGHEQYGRLRDAALALLAADSFGGAAHCVELAVEYAKVRQQFGVPIGQFQGVKHQLANMGVDVEPARGLYWYAAHAWDHLPEQAARAAAMAKAHLADRYLQAARNTVEVHGGVGYTWEYDVQIYLKRAMFNYAYLGNPQLHRARAAELAGW